MQPLPYEKECQKSNLFESTASQGLVADPIHVRLASDAWGFVADSRLGLYKSRNS